MERLLIPFAGGPVGVRWSRMVEVGLGRLSRKGPRVGGTIGAPIKDCRRVPSPLLGAMFVEDMTSSAGQRLCSA